MKEYIARVSTVEKVEQTIRELSREELARFSKWFEDFLAEKWDAQMERDVEAGKLDKLADGALEDFKAGRCTPL